MKKILLVDDVPQLLDIQKRFLAYAPVHVLTASDGEEALEKTRRELPDLIIMDKYMPNMDGLDCCRRIKADPALAHIPVIMSSHEVSAAAAEESIGAGCMGILSKPIESRHFLAAVKKHIPDLDRRSTRVPVKLLTKLSYNGVTHRVTTENLSSNGIFAVTDLAVTVNDVVRFWFVLPDRNIPAEFAGRVVWQRSDGDEPGFGAEFMEAKGEGSQAAGFNALREFVTAHPYVRLQQSRAANC